MPPTADSDAVERITSARDRALKALASAAAGDSLCTLTRDRLPAAKYHEGATAALGDALRAVRRGDPPPNAESWADWADPLAARDANWRAYLTGGRDALAGASA